jgi:predicted nucleotidyltransferase
MVAGKIESELAALLGREEFSDVLAAYLFGSHAEDRAHAESDVDVGVLLDVSRLRSERERFDRRLELMFELAEAVPGRTLDLIILNDVPPQFGRHIVTRGRRIHCSDAEADHAFVRDVQLRAADLEPFLRRMRRLKLQRLRRP